MSQKHELADAAESARTRAPVTDRVNAEPSVLNGMTVTEAKVIASVSLALFLVFGGLVLAFTRVWQVMLLLGLFGPVATLWFGSIYLQGIKRGRPDGYYSQAIHLWLAQRSLGKPKFIRHHGHWELGRTLDFSLVSSLTPDADADADAALAPPPSRKSKTP